MTDIHNSIIVTLSGSQSPRALHRVMNTLSTPGTTLVDLGQLVVRNRFIATALITTSSQNAVKEIVFKAHAADLQVHFDIPPSEQPCSAPATNDQYVLTLISTPPIPPRLLAKVTALVQGVSGRITNINRLSLPGDALFCLELRVDIQPDVLATLQKDLFLLGRSNNCCDMALHRADISRRAKRIVVFDLSWTLVQCDAVNVLLQAAGKGVGDEVENAFREGRMEQSDYLRERVKLLRGLDEETVNEKAVASMTFTNGAVELCKGLKRLGCKLAVVSSGSKAICEAAKAHLSLDFCFGNVLEVDTAGSFTGTVREPVIDMERKGELVQMLAMEERVELEQIVAVGDGPVSSKMLASVGMSIAFDQPEETGDVHSGLIASKSLASVLYLLGVGGKDFKTVTKGLT